MKKITTILMLLMLTCMGAKAGEVTTWTTAGSIVTKDALAASVASGKRYAFRMPSKTQPGWCGFNSTTGRVDNLDVAHLFTIENGSVAGKYWLKRYSNGEYLSGNNAFSASAGINLTLTNRIPKEGTNPVSDYDTGYNEATPFVSFDNDAGQHYNNGNTNYDFRGGTGGWSVYVTYGPFYIVNVKYQTTAGETIKASETKITTDNTTVEAPEIGGYAATGTTSYTVNGADLDVTFTYEEDTSVPVFQVKFAETASGLPTAASFGTFSGQTFTTAAGSGKAGVTVTASEGLTIGEQTVSTEAAGYGNCLKFVTAAAATNYTVTLSAPTGYYIKEYYMACSANSNEKQHTLTPENGDPVVVTSPPYQGNVPKDFKVTGLNAQTTSFTISTANEGNALYVPRFTVTIVREGTEFVEITYVVKENNVTVFTSEPQEMYKGAEITALPEEFKNTMFYDYAALSETADATKNVEVTATVKSDAPFTPSASFANAVWHNLTLSANNNIPTYKAGQTPNVTIPLANADDETTQWAFIGYKTFKIVNKAAGEGLVLGSAVTTGSTETGKNVLATLQNENSQANEVWTVEKSNKISGKNGFFLRNTENHALNKRNEEANISYWTGGADAGSTFVATKVPGLEELLPQAKALLTTLTNGANDVQIGYPTADALSTFSNAIVAAEAGTLTVDELKAAIAAVKSPANTNYTPRTDVYYTITSARGSMIYHPNYVVTGKENISFLFHTGSPKQSGALNVALDATNPNHQWGFIEKDGKYYMYNVGKKQFANVTQNGSYTGNNGDKHTWMFSEAPSAVTLDAGESDWVPTPNVRVRATSEVTGKQYAMSISQSYDGPVIAYDAVNDGGIPMTFAVATTTQDQAVTTAIENLLENLQPYRDALQEAINNANALQNNENIGEGLGKYTLTGDMDALNSAVTAATAELAKEDSETSKAALSAALQALETALANMQLTLNMPKANTFLRIKSVAQNGYVSSKTGAEVGGLATTSPWAAAFTTGGTADEASTIWLYDGEHLISYATGLYSTGYKADAIGVETPKTYEFKAATDAMGKYWIKPEGTNYWYGGNPTLDYHGGPVGTPATRFELEEVTELPITLKEAQCKDEKTRWFATFSAPVAVSEVVGAEIHKVTDMGNSVKVEPANVTGIPAGTAVLLVSETAPTESKVIIGATDAEITTVLSPLYACEEGKAGLFFGKGGAEGYAGFYKLNPDTKTGGFKAYIADEGSGAKMLDFGNEATGIDTVENSVGNGAVYNLQGQRVNKAQKGVFIQNGKKVVLK